MDHKNPLAYDNKEEEDKQQSPKIVNNNFKPMFTMPMPKFEDIEAMQKFKNDLLKNKINFNKKS